VWGACRWARLVCLAPFRDLFSVQVRLGGYAAAVAALVNAAADLSAVAQLGQAQQARGEGAADEIAAAAALCVDASLAPPPLLSSLFSTACSLVSPDRPSRAAITEHAAQRAKLQAAAAAQRRPADTPAKGAGCSRFPTGTPARATSSGAPGAASSAASATAALAHAGALAGLAEVDAACVRAGCVVLAAMTSLRVLLLREGEGYARAEDPTLSPLAEPPPFFLASAAWPALHACVAGELLSLRAEQDAAGLGSTDDGSGAFVLCPLGAPTAVTAAAGQAATPPFWSPAAGGGSGDDAVLGGQAAARACLAGVAVAWRWTAAASVSALLVSIVRASASRLACGPMRLAASGQVYR